MLRANQRCPVSDIGSTLASIAPEDCVRRNLPGALTPVVYYRVRPASAGSAV